jgi:hypothetical protein
MRPRNQPKSDTKCKDPSTGMMASTQIYDARLNLRRKKEETEIKAERWEEFASIFPFLQTWSKTITTTAYNSAAHTRTQLLSGNPGPRLT